MSISSKCVVIVDPYLGSRSILYALKKNKLDVIAVYTIEASRDFLEKKVDPQEFVRVLKEADVNYSVLIKELKSFDIIRVMIGSETAVTLALKIAHDLKLSNSIPLEDNDFLGNKYLTGKFLKEKGLFPIKQIEVTQQNKNSAIEEALEKIGFPLIIKPQKSAGSYGITFCYSKEDLEGAVEKFLGKKDFLGYTLSALVIQERLEGKEFAICTLSTKLKHKIIGILSYDQQMLFNQNMIRALRIVDPEDNQYASIIQYVKNVLDAVDYQSGPAAIEVMQTKSGPCLIELNPRAGGLNLEDLFIQCIGTSQGELLASSLINEKLSLKNVDTFIRRVAFGATVFLHNSRQNNRLSPLAIDSISKLPSFKQIKLNQEANTILPITTDLFTTIGYVLISNPNEDQFNSDFESLMGIEKKFFS